MDWRMLDEKTHRKMIAVLGFVLIGCAKKETPQAPQAPARPIAESSEELVQHLALAYAAMDHEWFTNLLATDTAHPGLPDFCFIPDGISRKWGSAEESLIHTRVFEPGADPCSH
jgi:hypothetical protein